MSFISLGTEDQLQIRIPIQRSTGWAQELIEEFFQKVVEHDHSGNGKGVPLGAGALADNSVTNLSIRLNNNEFLRSRNTADDADIDIVKVNTSNEIELGASVVSLDISNNTTIGGDISIAGNTTVVGKSSSNTVNLSPLADPPTSPIEGDTYYDNGTNRTRGLYTYDGGVFNLPPSNASADLVVKIENGGNNDLNMDLDTQYLINRGATSASLVLQPPSSVPGRLLYVQANDIGTSASILGGGSISVNSNLKIGSGFPSMYLFISDGTRWTQIGQV